MPFSLETETQVTVSMGLETTAGVGAAYNTRLYIDQVKLYSKDEIINDVSGILGEADTENVDVYNLQGMKLRSNVPAGQATRGLSKGIYIVGHKRLSNINLNIQLFERETRSRRNKSLFALLPYSHRKETGLSYPTPNFVAS